jgi:cytochrome c5
MKKIISFIAFAIAITTVVNCTSTKKTQSATTKADPLAIAQKRWPDATAQSLVEGEEIYNGPCKRCHGDSGIANHSEAEWDGIIKKMAPKAKLTPEQTETLRRYIYTTREATASK